MGKLKEEEEVREGYKKTALGWIPVDWEVGRLEKYSDFITKGSTPTTYGFSWVSKGILFLRSECVTKNGISLNGTMYISEEANKTMRRSQIRGGDILMTITGNVGRVGIYPVKYNIGNINQHIAKIRINNPLLDLNYVYQYLLQDVVIKDYHRITTGQAYPQLSLKQVRGTKVLIPPLLEQKAISKILTTWDNSIQTLQALINQKQLQKKWLMQQLLTGKKRLPGFEGEWEIMKLKEVTERVKRKNVELNDNVVTISAKRGFVLQETFFNKRVASNTLSNYYLLKKGEFAYNKSYSKGYPMGAFKRLDTLDKGVVTTLYICFSVKPVINSDFLLFYFEGGLMIKELMKVAQEGGRAHGLLNISLGDFFALKLNVPHLKEQKAIAEVLTKADQEIKLLEQKLLELKEQKKGLMQQLLTGKKRLV